MLRGDAGEGRPTHGSAAKQVPVNMEHALQRVPAVVEHETVARLPDAEDFCHMPGGEHDLPGQVFVFRRKIVERCDMFQRNDEHMLRGYRGYIVKRHDMFIPIDHCRRNFPADDPAEKAIVVLV